MDKKTTRFEIRLSPELGDGIDEWRRSQPDIPPRAEAARRLIELGLAAIKHGVAVVKPRQAAE